MKTRSAKNKGKKLQNTIRDLILENFSELEVDDVRSTGMGQPGADVQLSPFAKKKFPFSIEAKNQEKINIWSSLKQCEANAEKDELTPVLVFKRNHSKIYVVLEIDAFMELIKGKESD